MLINIHSFIDVITNSSTEIYVKADAGTINSVKSLVNSLLEVADSTLRADDLFDFELIDEDLDDILHTWARRHLRQSDGNFEDLDWDVAQGRVKDLITDAKALQVKPEWYTSALKEREDDYEGYYDINLQVLPKDLDNKKSVVAAKILSGLASIFNMDACYNG